MIGASPAESGTPPESGGAPAGAQPSAGLARSAGILSLGNIGSRLIGLARESVISGYFGSSGALSAFNLAARVPTMIYDLLVGGMLSAALVPVFSDYATPERRPELVRIASAVLSMFAVVLAIVVAGIELLASPLASLLGDFDDPALQGVLATSLRVIAPAVLLFGLTGAITGLLYSLRRFHYTAASGAVFNLGIVLLTPLLASKLGIYVLPLGIVTGSLLQIGVMLPGLRDLRVRFTTTWNHPAVRRILRLYVPIALGLIFTQFQIIVDGRWASATGEQSVAWMRYATTLIQMPLGLVPVAVSLAALPSLAQRASAGNWDDYRRIFGRGLRMVIILLIPATVGLWVLAKPVIALLFQHGNFTLSDTGMTATALRVYLIGLPFAGVDFLLNYSFYARQDTRTPAIVGVASIGVYFIGALALKGPLGFLGLVLADSMKQAAHAIIMSILLVSAIGPLRELEIARTMGRSALAAAGMSLVLWLLAGWVGGIAPDGFVGELIVVGVCGAVGGGVYMGLLHALGVDEMTALVDSVVRRGRSMIGRR